MAAQVRKAFESASFIVDVDDSYGVQAPRKRIEIDQDSLEFFGVQQGDVFETLRRLYGQDVVGYSHRGEGRQPLPIRLALAKNARQLDEAALTTPVPANALPGNRAIVELGDVVRVSDELSSFPIFRHNGRAAEMVQAELAGAYEAPLYGMLAVNAALDKMEFPAGVPKPQILLHGQPLDESKAVAAVGRRVGSHLGDLPRHGRGLHGGAGRHLHSGGGAVPLVQAAAGDPDADPADLHRHHARAIGCSTPPSPRPR